MGSLAWINVVRGGDCWRTCENGSEPSGSVKGVEFL